MSRASRITRRGLLAGVSAAVLASAVPALARPHFLSGSQSTAIVSSVGQSITWQNTSGSTSPANTPLMGVMTFPRGVVPSGSIAVPQESGVDMFYQADPPSLWDDGSLAIVPFRVVRATGIAGNSWLTAPLVIRSGSYSTTSAITTASVTGETDIKIALSNCHTAMPAYTGDKLFAVTLDGSGGISGVVVKFPANMTVATTNVTQGGGTGGQISITSGVGTVVSPGTGYGYVGGTGAATVALNTIIAAVASGGNRANGVRIERYSMGQVCDAWMARTSVSGFPHYHVTIFAERWKKPDGTLLDYQVYATFGTGLVDTVNAIHNYTYDLDFLNGATVIVGANGGDTRYQTILNPAAGSAHTLDIKGLPYWLTNDAARKAVVRVRTPDECDYFKRSKIITPYLNEAPTVTVPTTHSAYELSSGDAGISQICDYVPFGTAGIRTPQGSGGSGNQEGAMSGIDALAWKAQRASKPLSEILVWLQAIRVGAAHSSGIGENGGGFFEPTTMGIPNVIPSATQTFGWLTPSRSTISTHPVFIADLGYAHPLIASTGGLLTSLQNSTSTTYHQVCATFGAYLNEAHRGTLETLTHAATTPTFGRNPASGRQATVGATTYYGIYCNRTGNVRDQAWWKRSAGFAVFARPAAWADGTTDVERTNIDFTLKSQHDYLNALIPFTGSPVKFGSTGSSLTKTMTSSDLAGWPEDFSTLVNNGWEGVSPFMDDYELMVLSQLAYLLQGTPTGTAIASFLAYWRDYYIGFTASSHPHYFDDSFRLKIYESQPPSTVANPGWVGCFDPATPGVAVCPEVVVSSGVIASMAFTSGSSTVTINDSGGVRFSGTTRMANGSRIMLTSSSMPSASSVGVPLPTGLDGLTWYYWNELTASTGQLCTDAGLTTPVTAGAAASNVSFWVVFANSPPALSAGTYNKGVNLNEGGRIATKLGATRMCKVYDMSGDARIATAITNMLAIFNAIPGQAAVGYSAASQYGIDDNAG